MYPSSHTRCTVVRVSCTNKAVEHQFAARDGNSTWNDWPGRTPAGTVASYEAPPWCTWILSPACEPAGQATETFTLPGAVAEAVGSGTPCPEDVEPSSKTRRDPQI